MTKLDSILKSRDITWLTKVHLVKAMVFPVVMCGCESCNIMKAKRQSSNAFELWCWRKLLRVPWNARRSNQSILKEISPEYSLEGLMLKMKLQYFGHLMWRTDSVEKTLMLGKIEGRRRMGWQRMRWLDGIADWMDMSFGKLKQLVMDREALVCFSPWGCKELDTTVRTELSWTDLSSVYLFAELSFVSWRSLAHFSKLDCFLLLSFTRFYIFWTRVLYKVCVLQIFSPSDLSFHSLDSFFCREVSNEWNIIINTNITNNNFFHGFYLWFSNSKVISKVI